MSMYFNLDFDKQGKSLAFKCNMTEEFINFLINNGYVDEDKSEDYKERYYNDEFNNDFEVVNAFSDAIIDFLDECIESKLEEISYCKSVLADYDGDFDRATRDEQYLYVVDDNEFISEFVSVRQSKIGETY